MEIAALQQIVRDRYFENDNARGDKENAKEEFGDVLMWMLTLANLMNVDMEEVVATYLDNPRKKLPGK